PKVRAASPGAAALIVAVRDFSGLTSSALAFAKTEARAPTDSLGCCMAPVRFQHIQAHRAGVLALCPHPMSHRPFFGFGHDRLKLAIWRLAVEKSTAGAAEQRGELRPGIRRTHIDDADRFDTRPRRLGINEVGRLAGLDAAPELLFGRHQHT